MGKKGTRVRLLDTTPGLSPCGLETPHGDPVGDVSPAGLNTARPRSKTTHLVVGPRRARRSRARRAGGSRLALHGRLHRQRSLRACSLVQSRGSASGSASKILREDPPRGLRNFQRFHPIHPRSKDHTDSYTSLPFSSAIHLEVALLLAAPPPAAPPLSFFSS